MKHIRWHDPIRIEGTPERRRYLERVRQQVINWLAGRSVHNAVDDECCPDFSCCVPDMLMSQEQRNRYVLEHVGGLPHA